MKKILYTTSLVSLPSSFKRWIYGGNIILYRISVAERGLTGIANISRSRLTHLLRAGTVPLMAWWKIPRFFQIRLGKESCDQISASPNRPKRAKSCDKTAGSLFTRAYTLVKSVKLKGVSSRFYNKTYKDKWYINIIIVYTKQLKFC